MGERVRVRGNIIFVSKYVTEFMNHYTKAGDPFPGVYRSTGGPKILPGPYQQN
jgi:hypothetical protein